MVSLERLGDTVNMLMSIWILDNHEELYALLVCQLNEGWCWWWKQLRYTRIFDTLGEALKTRRKWTRHELDVSQTVVTKELYFYSQLELESYGLEHRQGWRILTIEKLPFLKCCRYQCFGVCCLRILCVLLTNEPKLLWGETMKDMRAVRLCNVQRSNDDNQDVWAELMHVTCCHHLHFLFS